MIEAEGTDLLGHAVVNLDNEPGDEEGSDLDQEDLCEEDQI